MVAELLRLRLRILVNGFRGRARHTVGIVVVLLAAIASTVLLVAGARWLNGFETLYVIRATVVVGSWLSLAAIVVPLIGVRQPTLSPRAFLGYGMRWPVVALVFLVFALIGPGILMVPIAWAPTLAWRDDAAIELALAAAPLLFLQGLLSVKLARRLGVVVRRHPRLTAWVDTLGVLALAVGALIVLVVLAGRVPGMLWLVRLMRPLNEFFAGLPDRLAITPLGMLWAAPGYGTTWLDDPSRGWEGIAYGGAIVAVLLIAWFATVRAQLRPTRKLARARRTRVPGWFAHVPSTPTGAIAARSFTYWVRDPRYVTVFVVVPLVPLLMLLVFWVGGVPLEIAVLVPLPVMLLLLTWSNLHNDVAYDNTAVWQHVAAQTRGVHDRRGRAVPVLVWGVVLLAVGLPVTVWAHGDLDVAAPFAGVCAALLFGGLGVASAYSARFPYAAPRPGDPAWQAPQVAGSQGGVAQGMSLLLALGVAAPALVAFGMWWLVGGWWGWLALAAGVVCGLVAFVGGMSGGGAVFDRRAPELLAFALRN